MMITNKLLPVLLFILICCDGSDETISPHNYCERYAEGEVIVRMDSLATLEELLAITEERGLRVLHLTGIRCVSSLPTDSLDFVQRVLRSRGYINNYRIDAYRGGTAYVDLAIGQIMVFIGLLNPDVKTALDWREVKETARLTDIPTRGRFALLAVPVGMEEESVRELPMLREIASAELNCYADIRLMKEL